MNVPVAPPQSLFDIRSRLGAELMNYYAAAVQCFSKTEWTRAGGARITVENILIDAMVYRKVGWSSESDGRDRHRERAASDSTPDRARIDEEPLRDQRTELVRWKHEIPSIRKAVVLGAPGGGKTTLACDLMIQTAKTELEKIQQRRIDLREARFPVFIPLEKLGATSSQGPIEDSLWSLLHPDLPVGPIVAKWIKPHLFSERCLWVLDGLDQVGGREPVERVGRLLSRIGESRSRAVVTCRTASFTGQLVPGRRFVRYDLAPFEPSDIRRLVEKWYVGDSRERGSHLLSVFRDNPSLEDSCRTPLIATLACLANQDRELPRNMRRVDLYESVIRRFQEQEGRSGLTDEDREIEFDLLQGLAWRLFSKRPEANRFTGAEVLRAASDGNKSAAGALMKRLTACRLLIRGAKVVETGAPQYSFAHRTFLEFLAAKYLAGSVDAEGWDNTVVEMPQRSDSVPLTTVIDKKSWLPAWSQMLILLTGCLRTEGKHLIDLVWKGRVDIAWHRRALALQCLAELKADERDEQQVDSISEETFEFLRKHRAEQTEAIAAEYEKSWRALGTVNGRIKGKRLLDRLTQHTESDSKSTIDSLRLLGPAVAFHRGAVQYLLSAIRAPYLDANVRSTAARALKSMETSALKQNGVVPELLEIVLAPDRDMDFMVRLAAADALATVADWATTHRHLIQELLEIVLSPDTDHQIRLAATRPLGAATESAAEHQSVIPALLGSLPSQGGYSAVFSAATATLSRMAESAAIYEGVVPTLLHIFLDPQRDELNRVHALRVLGEMTEASGRDEEVAPALLQIFVGRDNDIDLRLIAAAALVKMPESVARWEGAFQMLLRVLLDPETHAQLRTAAAEVLESMSEFAGRGEEALVAELLNLVLSPEADPDVRYAAAGALGFIGHSTGRDEVIPDLLHLFSRPETDTEGRMAALRALKIMVESAGRDERTVRAMLDAFLAPATDFDVRNYAAEILGTMVDSVKGNAPVVPAMLGAFLARQTAVGVRVMAVEALKALGEPAAKHKGVISGLLSVICTGDAPNDLRRAAMEALGAMVESAARHEGAIPSLLRVVNDPQADIWFCRRPAADTLGKMFKLGLRVFEVGQSQVVWLDELAALDFNR